MQRAQAVNEVFLFMVLLYTKNQVFLEYTAIIEKKCNTFLLYFQKKSEPSMGIPSRDPLREEGEVYDPVRPG